MNTTISLVDEQLAALQQAFPGASARPLGNGTTLVTVPGVALPHGWNLPTTEISFLIPVGYPMARPDCFWADGSLRLAHGGIPMNTGIQPVPGLVDQRLWFSWHLSTWDPARDALLTYVRVVQNRLGRAQ